MSNNPFSEPEDSDRTIIRPLPGGRRPAAPSPPASPFNDPFAPAPAASGTDLFAQPAASGPAEAPEQMGVGGIPLSNTPLLAAAGPLLQLLARLRNTLNAPDAGDLRERAVREMRRFEEAARGLNLPAEQLRPSHYALCASLDDVVLATPWGSQSGWASHSLVTTFHQQVHSGERFFDILKQLSQNPGGFLPVLELMYYCLSLGYMGRYRLSPRGPAEIDRLREDTYAILRRQKPATEAGLSPRWQGAALPYRARRLSVPVWGVAIAALGVLAAVYAAYLFSLNHASDRQFAALITAPPDSMPPISRAAPPVPPAEPAPSGPTILDRLSGFLAPEIAAGRVSVLGTVFAPVVRINNHGLFASGSAVVEDGDIPLLEKIGTALGRETGTVSVTGYTDDQPIDTLQFPSNFELSSARAQAAAGILDQTIGDESRMTIKGMGAADPVADNATPDGRGQNRRIEITLNHPTGL